MPHELVRSMVSGFGAMVCDECVTSPGGGGAPILHVRGSGKHDDGRDFYFDLRSRVWGNEHGLVMNHLAELEAEWE